MPLVHADLYRIEHARALQDLGLEERAESAVLAIEWGERYLDHLDDGVHLTIAELSDGGRRLTVRALGERGRAWLARWEAG